MNALIALALQLGVPIEHTNEQGEECELIQLTCTEEGIQAIYDAPIREVEITGVISKEMH